MIDWFNMHFYPLIVNDSAHGLVDMWKNGKNAPAGTKLSINPYLAIAPPLNRDLELCENTLNSCQ